MKNGDIPRYALLDEHAGIKEALKLIAEQNQAIETYIAEVQNHCWHPTMLNEYLEDGDYCEYPPHLSPTKRTVLASKTCTECGYCVGRPNGQPWEICHLCWSSMKYEGKTPGQGGDGMHVYACTNPKCNAQIYHT